MRKKITDHDLSLEAVFAMFAEWRSNRKKREPSPPRLWGAAACLCETHPITHVWRIRAQGLSQLSSATRSISSSRTQIFTWASMRREVQWYMGVILIWVRLRQRKQRSMTIRLL